MPGAQERQTMTRTNEISTFKWISYSKLAWHVWESCAVKIRTTGSRNTTWSTVTTTSIGLITRRTVTPGWGIILKLLANCRVCGLMLVGCLVVGPLDSRTEQWLLKKLTANTAQVSLTANTIKVKLTNHFQRTRLITPSTAKHYSLDSEDDFRSSCRNVSHQRSMRLDVMTMKKELHVFLFLCIHVVLFL